MKTKVCAKCLEEKPLIEFGKHKGFKDGLRYICKVCDNARRREYYKANKELVLDYQKDYYKKHKKERQIYQKIYYFKRKGVILD